MPARGAVICIVVGAVSCASFGRVPETPGETSSGFGYVPLDGLAVSESPDGSSCFVETDGKKIELPPRPLLQVLPDLSVRFAVASLTANGALTYGPAKVTSAGNTYRAVLDYVNVDAVPIDFYVQKRVQTPSGVRTVPLSLRFSTDSAVVIGYEAHIAGAPRFTFLRASVADSNAVKTNADLVTIPIYVGVGMRLSADLRALKSGASLTSLGAIAAEAQADALSGTLTVQTLGIAGKSIATALPLPSKLDQTTVENGILALGTSRTSIYASSTSGDVITTPRIVGLYSPVGTDAALVNALYSELSRARPSWPHPCSRSNP